MNFIVIYFVFVLEVFEIIILFYLKMIFINDDFFYCNGMYFISLLLLQECYTQVSEALGTIYRDLTRSAKHPVGACVCYVPPLSLSLSLCYTAPDSHTLCS